tara:strand:- start:11173 stop:11844 length:672 start_codon:yes stop_codon:yes gene_type:complete
MKSLFLQTSTKYFFLTIILFLSSCYKNDSFNISNGDILFQDLDSSPLCDAIELVTKGYNGKKFSHVGIVVKTPDNKYHVLEAFTNGVDTVNLDVFLNRSLNTNKKPKVLVGRLRERHKAKIENAIEIGLNLIGSKYDEEFKINNDKFYCSELIYEIFFHANNKIPLFNLEPMTFKLNNKILDTWDKYFKELNIDVPENKLGINPGSISLSKEIHIIHDYEIDI